MVNPTSGLSVSARAWLRIVLLFVAGGTMHNLHAQYNEYDVKAAFLTSFSQYVRWTPPASSGGPVGIVGDDPFGSALGRTVRKGRRPDDVKGCLIVFISKSERGQVPQILPALGTGVLTVSDIEGFVDQGGMIGFTTQGGKVHFEINRAAAKRAGLEISSRLLKLASRTL